MQKITPFLWFNGNAEEAMNFYTSVFENSKIVRINRIGENKSIVLGGSFEIEGQQFHVLNGGPQFSFTPAISLFVNCETQEEIDEMWEKLTADGGEGGRCGWLKDKFGLSWQIIPPVLGELLNNPDPEKSKRVMNAMLQMNKIDIEALKQA